MATYNMAEESQDLLLVKCRTLSSDFTQTVNIPLDKVFVLCDNDEMAGVVTVNISLTDQKEDHWIHRASTRVSDVATLNTWFELNRVLMESMYYRSGSREATTIRSSMISPTNTLARDSPPFSQPTWDDADVSSRESGTSPASSTHNDTNTMAGDSPPFSQPTWDDADFSSTETATSPACSIRNDTEPSTRGDTEPAQVDTGSGESQPSPASIINFDFDDLDQ